MNNTESRFRVTLLAAGFLLTNSAYAFNMGNMANPSKWMGGNNDRDRYDDYRDGPGYGYDGPGYGYGGGPGYGYGAPGYGYGGGPGYGYGAPGYGYGGGPGYGGAYGAAPTYGAPGAGSSNAEIMQLKERIRQLEEGVR